MKADQKVIDIETQKQNILIKKVAAVGYGRI